MNANRRGVLSLTAAGLIHVAAGANATPADQPDLIGDMFIRQAAERGHTDIGWLRSYHSFSFGGYYDQRHMGFRSLRVINDDRIAAGRGFPTHPHRDMEIISYVLKGSLQHKDSTGQGAIISPDDIQMMSAGTGITHSEFNPSSSDANHFLQIWIEPALKGVKPRYSDKKVTDDQKLNRWVLIAGPDDSGAAVGIYQDARIYASRLEAAAGIAYTVERGRHAWLQVATGEITVNGSVLKAGDAIASSVATGLHVIASQPSDVLLFDLG